MQELLDKIGYLLMPEQFAQILPYCIWYWIVLFGVIFWIFREKK